MWASQTSRTTPFTTVCVRCHLKLITALTNTTFPALSRNMSHSKTVYAQRFTSVCSCCKMCLCARHCKGLCVAQLVHWCVCREQIDEFGVTIQATSEDGTKTSLIDCGTRCCPDAHEPWMRNSNKRAVCHLAMKTQTKKIIFIDWQKTWILCLRDLETHSAASFSARIPGLFAKVMRHDA